MCEARRRDDSAAPPRGAPTRGWRVTGQPTVRRPECGVDRPTSKGSSASRPGRVRVLYPGGSQTRDGFSTPTFCCAARPSRPPPWLARDATFARLLSRVRAPQTCLRTETASPFAQPSCLGRLGRLALWWIHYGISPKTTRAQRRPRREGAHDAGFTKH